MNRQYRCFSPRCWGSSQHGAQIDISPGDQDRQNRRKDHLYDCLVGSIKE